MKTQFNSKKKNVTDQKYLTTEKEHEREGAGVWRSAVIRSFRPFLFVSDSRDPAGKQHLDRCFFAGHLPPTHFPGAKAIVPSFVLSS